MNVPAGYQFIPLTAHQLNAFAVSISTLAANQAGKAAAFGVLVGILTTLTLMYASRLSAWLIARRLAKKAKP